MGSNSPGLMFLGCVRKKVLGSSSGVRVGGKPINSLPSWAGLQFFCNCLLKKPMTIFLVGKLFHRNGDWHEVVFCLFVCFQLSLCYGGVLWLSQFFPMMNLFQFLRSILVCVHFASAMFASVAFKWQFCCLSTCMGDLSQHMWGVAAY